MFFKILNIFLQDLSDPKYTQYCMWQPIKLWVISGLPPGTVRSGDQILVVMKIFENPSNWEPVADIKPSFGDDEHILLNKFSFILLSFYHLRFR